MEFLLHLWNNIQKKKENSAAPSLIHSDLTMVLRVIRDILSPQVNRIVIDSKEEYDNILSFINTYMPKQKYEMVLYEKKEPIFDAYGIEMEIDKILGSKVWLKSGGYIVIDMSEALVAIDVNTGRYVGKRNLADTILKTNLEAAKEIAYQLRFGISEGLSSSTLSIWRGKGIGKRFIRPSKKPSEERSSEDEYLQNLRTGSGGDDPETNAGKHLQDPRRALSLL